MKCMRKEERMSFRTLTNELKLGIGQKWDWYRNFGEKQRVGLRAIEDISRCLSKNETGLNHVYI